MSLAAKMALRAQLAQMGTMQGMLASKTGNRRGIRGDKGQQGDFLGIGKLMKTFGGFVPVIGPGIVAAGNAVSKINTKKMLSRPGVGKFSPTFTQPVSQAGFFGGGGPSLPGGVDPNSGGIAQAFGNAGGPSSGAGTQGYHLNKTGYWRNLNPLVPGATWIAPRTRWVKNRTRNPFNPRAASRGMSRLSSLSHGMKALEKNLRKLAPRHITRAPAKRGK